MSGALVALFVAARGAQFAAATLLVGASLFPFYASPQRSEADWRQVEKTMRDLSMASALLATLSALLWVGVSIVDLAGDVGGLFDAETLQAYFLETSFGKVWAFRLALAIALTIVALVARRRLFARNAATAGVAMLAAALLASQAWIGHPASLPEPERWIVIAAYGLHVLGGAVWLGALTPLGLLLVRSLRTGEGSEAAAIALRRFSPVGMVAVAAILLGGGVNALSRAQSFAAFIDSGWGRIVVFKFVAASAMIAIAAANRFVVMPRLPTHREESLAQLARNVALEQGAGLVVLAASSLLAVFHPPGMHIH